MLDQITFITLGQTPRDDLVPEIVDALSRPVAVTELGALDGVERAEIDRLAPGEDDRALVTRLRDSSQAVIAKSWLVRRLQELLDTLPVHPTAASVLLCTGDFSSLKGRGLFLDAQHLVDHGVDALSHTATAIGLVVPLERQVAEHHYESSSGQTLHAAVARPTRTTTSKRWAGHSPHATSSSCTAWATHRPSEIESRPPRAGLCSCRAGL